MEHPAWIDSLERRFGFLSIPFLLKGLILLNVLTFFMEGMNPGFTSFLTLIPDAVFAGQWWRTLTFLLIPAIGDSVFSLIFLLIYVMFMWMISDGVESDLGEFKLTFYIFASVICINVISLSLGIPGTHQFLFSSLLIYFSILYPEVEILLFFILPVKIKWIGIFTAALVGISFLLGGWTTMLLIIASFAGFLCFMGPWAIKEWTRRRETAARRRRFTEDSQEVEEDDR
jgi:hypothetical protein